jgi:D-arginine dehydrogenase
MKTDIVIIGAGIAGVSLAASLVRNAHVVLTEAEERPGIHATARSAALFAPGYGAESIRMLTRASYAAFRAGSDGRGWVKARPTLHIANPEQLEKLERTFRQEPQAFVRLTASEAEARVSILRPGCIASALLDERSADIDVDAMHQHYLRQFRVEGGNLKLNARASSISSDGRGWRVRLGQDEIEAAILVNAAGAWADEVATLAGLSRLGLQPKRRTAALVDAPAVDGFAQWPMVFDAEEKFYFKPDAGKLLLSSAEETDVGAHDAYADDHALAEGIERICKITTLDVKRAPRSWAGLRTFASDRVPVVGFDARAGAPFYWLAGQGGFGIQTAPAVAELAAAELLGREAPSFADRSLSQRLSPNRFRTSS